MHEAMSDETYENEPEQTILSYLYECNRHGIDNCIWFPKTRSAGHASGSNALAQSTLNFPTCFSRLRMIVSVSDHGKRIRASVPVTSSRHAAKQTIVKANNQQAQLT